MKKIDLDHDGVARKLKAAEYRGEPCRLDPFETEAVVDMLKELEALRAAIASFAPCDCGEGCCVDPANCAVDRLRALTAAPASAEPVGWRWDQATNEGDWQTAFTEHGEPKPSPAVHNVTPLYSSPPATNGEAMTRALDFIESLTADPLLMGVDDIEMTLEDVQDHARIELASIRATIKENLK